MRTLSPVLLVAALAGTAHVLAGSDITVTGELVEVACATGKGAAGRGDGHAACALDCAKRGDPLGILTDDAIYEVTGDFASGKNAKLLDFVAKTVIATGELTEHDGTKRLNVRTIRVK